MERFARGHDPGGAAAISAIPPGQFSPCVPNASMQRPARHYGTVAGFSPQQRRYRGTGIARYVLHPELVVVAGSLHTWPNGERRVEPERGLLRATLPQFLWPAHWPRTGCTVNAPTMRSPMWFAAFSDWFRRPSAGSRQAREVMLFFASS